jgi:hypothetical protein
VVLRGQVFGSENPASDRGILRTLASAVRLHAEVILRLAEHDRR